MIVELNIMKICKIINLKKIEFNQQLNLHLWK